MRTLLLTSSFLAAFFSLSIIPHLSLAQSDLKKAIESREFKAPWEISARTLSYKHEDEEFVAEGDVVISREDQSVYAQKAVYNRKTGMAEVTGDVRLEAGEDTLTCDRAILNLESQTGTIINGRLFLSDNHYYIKGTEMEKLGPNTYRVKDCHVTTCDGPTPAWSITASEMEVTIEGYGKIRHAAFRVREFPIFYSPYLIVPVKTRRQSGFLPPAFGRSDLNGTGVEIPFFWAISDQADATFYQRYMSERGYMQGAEFRYATDENSEGTVLFDILSDRKKKDLSDPDDVEVSPFPRENQLRYWLRGKADQDLPHGLVARVDGDYVSDDDYLREFGQGLSGFEGRPKLEDDFGRPVEENYSPLRTSRFRVSFDREEYTLQGGSAYFENTENPDHQDETPQPLAGLNFQLLQRRIPGIPVSFDLESDYNYIWRDAGVDGNRLALSPQLRVPLWFGPLEFEPFFRYAFVGKWFDKDGGGTETQQSKAYRLGARTLTNLERTYEIEWRNAKRVKHRIWPSLTYTYLRRLDEDEESPWFEPVNEENDLNRLTFSLANFLDARLETERGGVDYQQWVNLTLIQGYNIEEARPFGEPDKPKRHFEPLELNATLNIFSDLDFYSQVRWDHYDREISFADLSLDLDVPRSGGRKDKYRLDYLFRRGDTETISFEADIHLVSGFSAGTSQVIEIKDSESILRGYWLQYQGQCWGVKFHAEKHYNKRSFGLFFRLSGLGKIGW